MKSETNASAGFSILDFGAAESAAPSANAAAIQAALDAAAAKGGTHSFFDHDLTPRPSAWLLKSAFLPDEPLVRLAVFGGGPWRTNYVKCWLQELGVKRQYLLDHDVVFE